MGQKSPWVDSGMGWHRVAATVEEPELDYPIGTPAGSFPGNLTSVGGMVEANGWSERMDGLSVPRRKEMKKQMVIYSTPK